MAARGEIYRQRAADCLALADAAKDTFTKERFLELARQWSMLSGQIEKEEQEPKERYSE